MCRSPETNREITTLPDFRDEVIRKVRALARRRIGPAFRSPRRQGRRRNSGSAAFSLVPPRVIAIGSSTGGPQALASLLEALSPALDRIPVLVAQHMPPMFTAILAERLARDTGRQTKEGVDGEIASTRHDLRGAGQPPYDRAWLAAVAAAASATGRR